MATLKAWQPVRRAIDLLRRRLSRRPVSSNQAGSTLAILEHDLLMPKYLFHAPMDYSTESLPPRVASIAKRGADTLPLPPPDCRPGYAPDDDDLYLKWGKSDHDLIMSIIERHHGFGDRIELLDWGCSSGRVLRHFYTELEQQGWRLHGIDVQALLIEWMRTTFPPEIDVMTGSMVPHLPFRDASFDASTGSPS